eukprot:scaffold1169_cov367-Prasinococcus_capsulatus_cf.AAC.8
MTPRRKRTKRAGCSSDSPYWSAARALLASPRATNVLHVSGACFRDAEQLRKKAQRQVLPS